MSDATNPFNEERDRNEAFDAERLAEAVEARRLAVKLVGEARRTVGLDRLLKALCGLLGAEADARDVDCGEAQYSYPRASEEAIDEAFASAKAYRDLYKAVRKAVANFQKVTGGSDL